MKILFLFAVSLSFIASSYLTADVNSNPWELNVYTTQDIGKSTAAYGSDFQGIAGAGGNAYLSGFSLNLNNVPPNNPYSLYTGGNANFSNGTVSNGGIESGGNIFLNGAAIDGNISGGGNLSGSNGTIHGNVTLAGTKSAGAGLVITGSLNQNQPFTPTVNLPNITKYFERASTFWSSLSPTTTTTNQYGQIQVKTLTAGRNVVDLSLANINSSYGIALNGPSNAFVIFNISGLIPGVDIMKALSFQLSGGINFNDTLFNITGPATLSLSGGTYTSLLAPNSNVSFSSGLLQGNLVAQNLYGAGQVNVGAFTGFSQDQHHFMAVPEPMTLLTLGSLMLFSLLLARVRRQRANLC